jgi:hypothetical protein
MNYYLKAQNEADNRARTQQAHMYGDAMDWESDHQANMQHAQYATQSQYQQQGCGETSKSFSTLSIQPRSNNSNLDPYPVNKANASQVPESGDDRRPRRSSSADYRAAQAAEDEDPTLTMRQKLARMVYMSCDLGDYRANAPRASTRRDGAKCTYRAADSWRRDCDYHDNRDEPSLFSRRGGESPWPETKSQLQGEPIHDHRPSRPEGKKRDGKLSYRASESRRDGRSSYRHGGYASRPGPSRPTDGGMSFHRASGREHERDNYRPDYSRRSAEMDPHGEVGDRRSRYD